MKLGTLLLVSLVSIALGVMLGSVYISPVDCFKDKMARNLMFNLRLPRVISAFLVGAVLSVVGNSYQGLFKNPLLDPYLLGVSAGASFGAALSLSIAEVRGYTFVILSPLFAFAFSLFSAIIALLLSRRRGRISSTDLVLSGATMNIFFGALTLFFLFYIRRSSQGFTTWIFGSFSATVWSDATYALFGFIIAILPPLFLWRSLDAMTFGEDFAKVVGVETERVKLIVFLSGVLSTSVVVSRFGSIGFVGLVIPHITRRLFGYSHKTSVPSVTLLGGTFLVLSDLVSRVVASPSEVPIGVITSFVGIPFFFYIMRR